MTAITGEMLEYLEDRDQLIMPNDSIKVSEDGEAFVEVDHFELKGNILVPKRTVFREKIGKVLSGFTYLKPNISDVSDPSSLLRPEAAWENKTREGCHVVGKVDDSARMAIHMDAVRNAFIVLVNEGAGVWNTRYFPESNIPKQTWDQGNALLNS